ncbi:MAG: hypothetical protein V1923_01550 [Candidatus Omnitrophota bacterium]
MEKKAKLLILVGVLCLIFAVIGVFLGTFRFIGIKSVSYILLAQTSFLLAILAKLFEKK